MKVLIVIMMAVILSGCNTFGQPRIDYRYKDVYVPISNVPVPPMTDCPVDAVAKTSKDAPDGEVGKAYRIAVLQLRDCANLRQKVLDKYRELAAEDKTKIDELNSDLQSGPLSAAGPTAESVNDPAPTPEIRQLPQEMMREAEVKSELGRLESEFDDLKNKEYEIDDV